jgi:hypothetical protein
MPFVDMTSLIKQNCRHKTKFHLKIFCLLLQSKAQIKNLFLIKRCICIYLLLDVTERLNKGEELDLCACMCVRACVRVCVYTNVLVYVLYDVNIYTNVNKLT